jgi:hypothetical protein
MNKYINRMMSIAFAGSMLAGCTKLNEERFGNLSPDTYYKTEAEALSSVAGVYQKLSYAADINDWFRVNEFGTDEFIVPGRASGGWFDQDNMDIMNHDPKPNNNRLANAWNLVFSEIGTANAVLENLNASPNKDNFKALIAETRLLRAYGYFYAMDMWGNLPLVTVARIDPNKLPVTTSRADIFKFIESEITEAMADIPSVTEVNKANYYPRFTRESAETLLATMYLNAEVYTNTPQWDKTVAMCDAVINTGAFALAPDVVNNFSSTLQMGSMELISAFSIDPTRNAGGNQFILYAQNALDQKKYNLPFTPANGYSTYQEALDRYDANDNRKKLIEYGPQTYLDGTPLNYPDGTQLVLIAVQDLISAQDNEGYKVLKYTPVGTTWSGYNGDNDYVLTRYADVLLMKAEALFRNGNSGGALTLVNQVRLRSNATELTALTLKDIENERAREFIWEGQRRRDMIRFGTYFTGTWAFKTTTTSQTKGIYPIPMEQLTANPNLTQNPGY